MNAPHNPYRDEHRKLNSLGNNASGRGEHALAMNLWRQAAELKRKGAAELAAVAAPAKAKCDHNFRHVLGVIRCTKCGNPRNYRTFGTSGRNTRDS
jgi:hypothetical protein